MIAAFAIGHPPLEGLRAFAEGSLGDRRRARVAAHLERCQRCRLRIATYRTVVSVAREELEPPAPAAALERVLARRAAGERRILPPAEVTTSRIGRGRSRRSWTRAAGFALVATLGVAAAAAAMSPRVRDWIASLAPAGDASRTVVVPHAGDEAAGSRAGDTAPAPLPVAGAAIETHADSLWVTITAGDRGLRLRVRLTDERELEVRGIGPTADARFTPRADGIGVRVAGAGELQIDVPRIADHMIVSVNGELWLVKDRDELRVLTPRADTAGTELLLTPQS